MRVIELFRSQHSATDAGYQHPGGMQWWLRRMAKDDFRVFVWGDDAALKAFAIDDAGYLIPRVAHRELDDLLRVVEWSEQLYRSMGRSSIDLSAADGDDPFLRALADRGYAPAGSASTELVYEVEGEPATGDLPPGYRLGTIDDVGDDAYIDLHRAAWSTVRPSDYSRVLHDIVTSMPDFRRDMVPVAIAADGSPAAYCIGWFDAASRSVEIEPLGTHPDHRQRGIGRAIVRDVQRRARARGARSVMVWGGHNNAPAMRLYTSSDMKPRRVVREYRRAL